MQKNALAEGRSEEKKKIIENMDIIDKEIICEASAARKIFQELQSYVKIDSNILLKIRGLGSNFLRVMEEFERVQKVYSEKCRQQIDRQLMLIDPSGNGLNAEMLSVGDGKDDRVSSPLNHQIQIFRLSEDSRARRELELESLKGQRDEMQKLEKGLQEIHSLFQDIRMLVQEQGDTIFRIQDLVDDIEGNVKKTVGELEKKCEREMKRQRRRRWFLGIGLLVLIGLVLIILSELFW